MMARIVLIEEYDRLDEHYIGLKNTLEHISTMVDDFEQQLVDAEAGITAAEWKAIEGQMNAIRDQCIVFEN